MRKSILFVLLISGILFGCQAPVSTTDSESLEFNSAELEKEQAQVLEPVLVEPHSEKFSTLNEYSALIQDSNTNQVYKTDEPRGVVMVKSIIQEGTDSVRYQLWANEDWESKGQDAEQIFYIKGIFSEPYQEESSITWFGPFSGQLGLLVL